MHFQWTHLHESESPPFGSSDVDTLPERLRLFVLLSHTVRAILAVPILSDSFLDCLPRGGRILPRRILMRTPAISCLGGGKIGRRAVYLDEMAIVRVLIVSAEQSSMTELAFGTCGRR